jgi:hypothetical protein
MQSVYKDASGILRFRANRIVQYILDHSGIDMNKLSEVGPFDIEDREQFAQLIGYSVAGYGELPYVSDRSYDAAVKRCVRFNKANPPTVCLHSTSEKKGGA